MVEVPMTTDWVNPCGGTRWRTLDDGAIEVEGQGVPMYAADSSNTKYLSQTWANWKPHFQTTAKKFGLPVSWLVAIATMETGMWSGNPQKQATILGGDGTGSLGIMQPLPSVSAMYGYQQSQVADPGNNIDVGGHVILAALKTANGQAGGFPVVAAMYNGGASRGGCNVGNDEFNLKGYGGRYVGPAIRYQNAAIRLLKVNAASGNLLMSFSLGLLATGGLAVGMLWYMDRHPR
jgi:soluble lytic murein transglycosylase-like protein